MERITVGILLFDLVEVLDFAGPFEVFSRARLTPGTESRRTDESAPFRVLTVAEEKRPITATGGLVVVPEHGFADCPTIDLLVVPGGFGTRNLLDHEPTLRFVRERAALAKTAVTSVCTGSLLLARTGLLRGRKATTHWAALDLLESLGEGVLVEREERVVEDGVISSAGVASGIDMAFHMVAKLCGQEVAVETAKYIEYRWPAETS